LKKKKLYSGLNNPEYEKKIVFWTVHSEKGIFSILKNMGVQHGAAGRMGLSFAEVGLIYFLYPVEYLYSIYLSLVISACTTCIIHGHNSN